MVDYVTTKYIYSYSTLLFSTDENSAKLTEHILFPNGRIITRQRFSGTYANKYDFYDIDIRNSIPGSVTGGATLGIAISNTKKLEIGI